MKRKLLRMSGDLLMDFLKNPVAPGLTQDGLPDDASIVGTAWDGRILTLVLQSTSFETVKHGDKYPILDVTYRKHLTVETA